MLKQTLTHVFLFKSEHTILEKLYKNCGDNAFHALFFPSLLLVSCKTYTVSNLTKAITVNSLLYHTQDHSQEGNAPPHQLKRR